MGSPWCCALVAVLVQAASRAPTLRSDELFPLSVVHMNDFHARFEQIAPSGVHCKRGEETTCVGGIARVVAMARQLLRKRPNPLLLNAGDNFQGTLWYTIYGWNVTADFMNRLPWDAFVLGNHEFDSKVPTTVSYIQALNAPVVVANIDATEEPSIKSVIEKSVVVVRAGRKIGIIGILTQTTPKTSYAVKLVFGSETSAVAEETQRLKHEGVDIIVVLSHSGIGVDLAVAETEPYVDLVVGGHSHTLLHTGTPPDGSKAYDVYPIIVTQLSGRKVAVVQAGSLSRYLGNLTAYFDANGELASAEGNTIYLDHSVEPDAEVLAAMQPLAAALGESLVVGRSAVLLESGRPWCYVGECNLGSFVADAYAHAFAGKGPEGSWTRAAIGITNSGGLRAPIAQGDVTQHDVLAVLPFHNSIVLLEVRGVSLRAALEQAVSVLDNRTASGKPRELQFFGFLQVSGLHVVYDTNLPKGERVRSVKALCHACLVPKYEPLQDDVWYPVALNGFLADGGDGFDVFRDEGRNLESGSMDFEVVVEYLKVQNPVVQARDERIVFIDTMTGKERLCSTQG